MVGQVATPGVGILVPAGNLHQQAHREALAYQADCPEAFVCGALCAALAAAVLDAAGPDRTAAYLDRGLELAASQVRATALFMAKARPA